MKRKAEDQVTASTPVQGTGGLEEGAKGLPALVSSDSEEDDLQVSNPPDSTASPPPGGTINAVDPRSRTPKTGRKGFGLLSLVPPMPFGRGRPILSARRAAGYSGATEAADLRGDGVGKPQGAADVAKNEEQQLVDVVVPAPVA